MATTTAFLDYSSRSSFRYVRFMSRKSVAIQNPGRDLVQISSRTPDFCNSSVLSHILIRDLSLLIDNLLILSIANV
jgi:hypothetical protein